jgi:pyridoxine/pyridoxamine 5'-phosphate oxidase
MIQFDNLSQELPYQVFKEKYENSLNAKQKNIEAICISSYSSKNNEVNARYVNLKFVSGRKFIFFSNYESPKSQDFKML